MDSATGQDATGPDETRPDKTRLDLTGPDKTRLDETRLLKLFNQRNSHMGTAIIIIILLAVYFIPTMAGAKKRNAGAIFVLNLFLGWTLVGWVVALVWACTKD